MGDKLRFCFFVDGMEFSGETVKTKALGGCVTGDTLIDVPRDLKKYPGGIPITKVCERLARGEKLFVYAYSQKQRRIVLRRITNAWRTKKNAEVWELTYRWIAPEGDERTATLRATSDHRVMRRDGTYAPLCELKLGDSLMPFNRFIGIRKAQRYFGVELNNGKHKPEHRFIVEELGVPYNPRGKTGDAIHHRNFQRFDNSVENLEVLRWRAHQKLHAGANPSFRVWYDELTPTEYDEFCEKQRQLAHSHWDALTAEQRLAANAKPLRALQRWNRKPENMAAKAAKISASNKLVFNTNPRLRALLVSNGKKTGGWNKGVPHTAEARKKMRVARASREVRVQLSERLKASWARCTPEQRLARMRPALESRGIQANHEVISVRKLTRRADVYDLEVRGVHNFVANGIVIHNSETAGYYMAKELAARGHDVTMFCKCPQEGVWDGVRYRHVRFFQEWAGSEPHDVTVIQRVPGPFTIRLASPVHLWWMHDLALRRYQDGIRGVLWSVDKILTVSEWMRTQYIETYGLEPGVIQATRNGIDLELIRSADGPMLREKLLVFTARPERGMDIFLGDVLPRIIKAVPDVTVILAGYENYVQELAGLYNRIQQLVAQYGGRVRHVGGLPKLELYKLYKRAAVYVYPTDFEEVSPARGDTLIDTPNGKFRIDSLVGKTNFPVYTYDEQNKRITIAKVRWVKRTRVNAQMLTIRYRYGRGCKANHRGELTVTPDHEVMLRDGSYIQAGKLQPGDRIMPFNRNNAGGAYKTKAGLVHMRYTRIHLNDGQLVYEGRFVLAWKLGRPLRHGEHADHIDGNQTNNAPENLQVVQGHREHRLAHFARMTPRQRTVLLKKRAQYLQAHRDRLTPEELFAEKSRAAHIGWERRRAALNHEVLEIVPTDNADGYCMSVTPHHNFVANGVIVHNCITAMECAACGLPFVASHRAALPETCIPEASLLVPHDEKHDGARSPEFHERFANEVIALLKDGDRRAKMGAAGMRGADRYAWSGVAAEWEALAYELMPATVRYE